MQEQPAPNPAPNYPNPAPQAASVQPTITDESEKNYVLAWILSYFLGSFGVDRFYLGHIPTGIVKLLTFGGFGFWTIIDWFLIAFGKLKAKDGKYLNGYHSSNKVIKILATVLVVFALVAGVGLGVLLAITTNQGIQQKSLDTERRVDLKAMQAQLEQYYVQNAHYPSFSEMNDQQFRTANFAGLDSEAYRDPSGKNDTLVDQTTKNSYAYAATPKGCGGVNVRCTSYSLSAIETDGKPFEVSSLNQ